VRGRGGSPAFEDVGGEREEGVEALHRPAAEEGVEALRRPGTAENAVTEVTAGSHDTKICAAKKMDAPHGRRVLVAGVQQPHRTPLAVRAWSPVARSGEDLGRRAWAERGS
jgi:hypothetical protein